MHSLPAFEGEPILFAKMLLLSLHRMVTMLKSFEHGSVQRGIFSLFVLLLAPLLSEPALAQIPSQTTSGQTQSGATADPGRDGWTFRLAPYVWTPAITGKVGLRGVTSDVYASIGDVVSNTDGGVMLAFEARNDRLSLNTDFIWARISDSSPSPHQIIFTKASATIDQIIWTEAVGYTLVTNSNASLDLLAGFRLVNLGNDLKLHGATFPSGEQVEMRKLSVNETWIDPVVGARALIALNRDWFVRATGDIGGFGANSDFTWQALTALGYQVCPKGTLGVGYRAIGYDHDRNGFRFDATLYGPFIGGDYHF